MESGRHDRLPPHIRHPRLTAEPSGTRRLYGVDPNGLRAVRTWVDGFWDQALASFKQLVEQEENG